MEQWISGPRISRENNYGILRVICATAVIYGHMHILMGEAPPVLFGNGVHALGFKLLMILSGYMITQSCIYEKIWWKYFVKRIIRILPALICSTIVTIVIGAFCTPVDFKTYWTGTNTKAYLLNILLNPRFVLTDTFIENPYYAVNGSIWALPIEFSLYIVIFIALKLLCKCKYKKWILAGITVALSFYQMARVLFFPNAIYVVWGTDWVNAISLYPFFFMGALYAVTDVKKYCNLQVAFILLFVISGISWKNSWSYEMMIIYALPYIIISFGECMKPIFKNFMKNTDVSYGMYLYGFVVQQIFIYVLITKQNLLVTANEIFVLAFIVSLIIGIISWKFVERPAIERIKEIMK